MLPFDEAEPLDAAPDMDTMDPALFVYEVDGELKELSSSLEAQVVSQITDSFKRYDNQKARIRRIWRDVDSALETAKLNKPDQRSFSGMVTYAIQTLNVLRAHYWGRAISTDKILFSCRGKDPNSQDTAELHRQNLLELFKKDRLQPKLDMASRWAFTRGVSIAFTDWRITKQQLMSQVAGTMGLPPGRTIGERTEYDGPSLKVIDPQDFVYDTDSEIEDWDKCFKAYRSWWVYEDIRDTVDSNGDPVFSNFEELKEQATKATGKGVGLQVSSRNRKYRQDEDTQGVRADGKIEMIEVYGDIRLPNGDLLRNWCLVLAGRKKLVRFEPNPYKINPFTMLVDEYHADGWGTGGPIGEILGLINSASQLLVAGVQAAKFQINPAYFAPQGMLEQKTRSLSPGDTIEYNVNLTLPQARPEPIPFNGEVPFPYLQLFESQAEATTGATRQLSGNVTTNDKAQTATEFQGLQVVGNLLLDREVDLFNLEFKLPIIRKMALLQAMYNPQERTIQFENENGLKEFKPVTQEVYFGDYDYIIDDNKSELDRKQMAQQKLGLLAQAEQVPELQARLDIAKGYQEIMRDMGFAEAAKLVRNDLEVMEDQGKKMMMQAVLQSFSQQAMQLLGPQIAPALMGGIAQGVQDDIAGQQARPDQSAAAGFNGAGQQPPMGQPGAGGAPVGLAPPTVPSMGVMPTVDAGSQQLPPGGGAGNPQ